MRSKWTWIVITVALTCYTLDQLRTAECRVACRTSGYEDGFFQMGKCKCITSQEYQYATEQKIKIPLPRKSWGAHEVSRDDD